MRGGRMPATPTLGNDVSAQLEARQQGFEYHPEVGPGGIG